MKGQLYTRALSCGCQIRFKMFCTASLRYFRNNSSYPYFCKQDMYLKHNLHYMPFPGALLSTTFYRDTANLTLKEGEVPIHFSLCSP